MASDGVLYAVDPYPVGRLGFSAQWLIARTQVNKVPNGLLEWLRSTGVEAAHYFDANGMGPVDFVFIDGDHSYEGLRGDWEAWRKLVAPDGIIALHDSRSSGERNIEDAGSVIFTREVILHDPRFIVVDMVDTLTVMKCS